MYVPPAFSLLALRPLCLTWCLCAAEGELLLPRNLSSLAVSDNLLQRLPLRALLAAPQLRLLDVRRNALVAFPPALVARVRRAHLLVRFDGLHARS